MTSNLFQRRRTFVIQQGATPLACSITARVRTVVELRRTHMPGYEIARRIGASPASVSRILRRALLTDNGSSYRSGLFRLACQQMHLKPRHPGPYTPRTNDKAERFIQTALREWAYAQHWTDSEQRDGHLQVPAGSGLRARASWPS